MKKIFLGLMACAALCACTSDDLVSGVTSQKVFEGDVAYMTVSIKDVGTATRATSPSENNGFGAGSQAEYAVSDAYFYFYDAEGVFVSEAEVWDGGTPSEHDETGVTPDGNVEFKSNTVIVLKGLTGKSYPNCVVTVLNKPTNFTPGETLDEMAALLADASGVGIMTGTNTNFTMSTSSYVPSEPFTTTTDKTPYYFVTPLSESDFYEEPFTEWSSEANDGKPTPVDIYVERLAAKVQVGIGETLAGNATEITDGESKSHTVYKLEVTIAGDPNVEDVVGEGDSATGDGIGAEDVYVEILGWGLNATAKHSNIVKDIDASWTNTGSTASTSGYDLGSGWSWNDPTDFRSYWGKSFNYGLTPEGGSYPTKSGGATDGTKLNDYLDYVTYSDLTLPTATTTDGAVNYTYCAENTNTAAGTTLTDAIITNKNSSAITSVLVAAKVWGLDDGVASALDLVRYSGELFEKKAYLNYVMAELTATGSLNVYTKETIGEEDVYTHIDGSYVTLEEGTDGSVNVVVVESAFEDTYYYYAASPDGYQAYDNANAAISAVTSALSSFNETADANAFTGGMMYYNIPIEHLNNTSATDEDTGLPIIYEANYGVVRNHWYRLTITSIEDLGTGVYDPDEVIIPNPDDVPTYYLGADIHILSWKMVGQGVDL